MLVSRGEHLKATLYKRKENSNEYNSVPTLTFNCRVANQIEKNTFQPTSGLITQTKGLYLYATRLPADVKPDDRIYFMGQYYLVETTGEYVSNARILSNDINYAQIKNSSPKGLKII